MQKSFTLVEIIIVVVILGIMAGFSLPVFTQTVNRSHARDAILNLNIIHASNVIYRTQTGVNLTAADITAINTALGLNVIANGAAYSCDGTDCVAVGPGFMATATLASALSATNPACAGASCP